MGTVKISRNKMWPLKVSCFLMLSVQIQISYCIRSDHVDEPHYIKIIQHPVLNITVLEDPGNFVPPEPPLKNPTPALVANCQCGEHDYADTKIESMYCGERPWHMRTSEQQERANLNTTFTSEVATTLVLNGNDTDKNQFPWVVALVHRLKNGSAVHFCGGTLISSRLVLTATHCFNIGVVISNTEVWLNEKNLLVSTEDRPTLKIKAKRLIIHPMYNPLRSYNDIALVELSEAVDIQESTLRPICLPFDVSYEKKHFAYIAGWGRLMYEGKKSDKLQHVCVPLLTHQECTTKTVTYYNSSVTEWMICAGDIKNGKRDACPGDSGGPLFVEDASANAKNAKKYTIVGVVSWGDLCGLPYKPGVYTRVSKYMAWIDHEARAIPDNWMCGHNR